MLPRKLRRVATCTAHLRYARDPSYTAPDWVSAPSPRPPTRAPSVPALRTWHSQRLAPGPRPAPPRLTTDRPAAPAQAFLRPRSKRRVGSAPLPRHPPPPRRPPLRAMIARLLAAAAACPRAATLAPSPDAHPAQTALRDRRSSDRCQRSLLRRCRRCRRPRPRPRSLPFAFPGVSAVSS